MLLLPVVTYLKLSWPISQEVPIDPGWDSADDVSADGLRIVFHRGYNLFNARKPTNIREVLGILARFGLFLSCG